jgi:uncharacterized protein
VLSPELVRARRADGELRLVALDARRRARALELATALLASAKQAEGKTRTELDEALAAVECAPSERKLCEGLAKLVLDQCEIEQRSSVDPAELRRELFRRAARARRSGQRFERERLIGELAGERAISADRVESGIYADLKAAHVLVSAPRCRPESLLERYERAQVQAVLLRAVQVSATVFCSSAAGYRELFRTLKFRRLLHRIERLQDGQHRIEISGPFSLFESVTKYGLQLALLLPALEACDRLELSAELRWGKLRERLMFRHTNERSNAPETRAARLPEEVQALLDVLVASDTPWRASRANRILELPGVGLCVPDLVLRHAETGRRVFLEVLGYWSREAVWRRVQLAERGLEQPILFAASSRLRVSEELLDGVDCAALYVYKRSLSARGVLERVAALAEHGSVAGGVD